MVLALIPQERGFYSFVQVSKTAAPNEKDIPLNVRSMPVDNKYAFTYMDGYQFDPWFSGEFGVTHLGSATDIFSGFIGLRSPSWHSMDITGKYGFSFSGSRIRRVYDVGLEYFLKRNKSVAIHFGRQYALAFSSGLSNGLPSTNIKVMRPLELLGVGYKGYFGVCDRDCRRERPAPSVKGDFWGAGILLLVSNTTAHKPSSNIPSPEKSPFTLGAGRSRLQSLSHTPK
jgi:hypothetical protein